MYPMEFSSFDMLSNSLIYSMLFNIYINKIASTGSMLDPKQGCQSWSQSGSDCI